MFIDFTSEIIEKEEEFIYKRICSYLEYETQYKIPKKLLIRAISCFAEEHPEEFKALGGKGKDKE